MLPVNGDVSRVFILFSIKLGLLSGHHERVFILFSIKLGLLSDHMFSLYSDYL